MANSSTAFLRNNSKVPSFSSTIMNYKTVIKWEDIIKLYSVIVDPNWYDSIISKPEDWLASLTYYPFDIYSTNANNPFVLRIGNHDTNIVTKFIDDIHNRYYNLGEYFVTRLLNNFADYNGYSKIEIYLPYFGLTEVQPNDCLGKWLQFRLVVDYNTGQGTYIIGVSDNSITNGIDDNVRILSTLSFQLGIQIPISSVGMADFKRNLTLGAVKTGVSIAASIATGVIIPPDITTTHHGAIYGRSKTKGSRMKMLQGEYDTTTTTNSHRAERTAISSAFEYSVEALNNMRLSPVTDRVNNPLGLYVGSESIQIIRYSPKIIPTNHLYNHLYGKPLGEVVLLSALSGYTEVSRIHFEGQEFWNITLEEYTMIEQAFSDGVIL